MANDPGLSDADMRARLDKLSQDLGARAKPAAEESGAFKGPNNVGSAMRLGVRVTKSTVFRTQSPVEPGAAARH